MITVSDAARFAEESVGTKKFKAWWETILDYTILGLLLLTIFSWAKVISVEASGLLCIPLNPKIGYSYNLAKYFNSRCAQEFDNKLLIYYPYFLFVLWLMLFFVQKLWLKIPVVRCRFESFHKIFTEMIKIYSKLKNSNIKSSFFQAEPKCASYSLKSSDENYLHEKESTTYDNLVILDIRNNLIMLLEKKSFLSTIYMTKNIVLLTILISTIIGLTYWISSGKLYMFKANFHCHLDGKKTFTPVDMFTCNFTSAPFLHVIILISITLQFLTVIFCTRALIWSFSKNKIFLDSELKEKRLRSTLLKYSGYVDLQFCFGLLQCTIQERNAILNVFEKCSKGHDEAGTTKLFGRNEDFVAVKYITDYLGLAINPSTSRKGGDSLFDCFQYLKNESLGKRI